MEEPIIVITFRGKKLDKPDYFEINLFDTTTAANAYIEMIDDHESKYYRMSMIAEQYRKYEVLSPN